MPGPLYSYDSAGNLIESEGFESRPDPVLHLRRLNRLTSVTQPWTGAGGGTAVTTYGYDVQDHLTFVIDAEGNTTTYTYSDRDLMTRQVSPVSGTVRFER